MNLFKLAVVPAVLAAMASAALAQSSGVNISGRVDVGVRRVPNSLTSVTDKGSNWQVAEGSTSRLQFSGREEISPDLTAFFAIEHRFNADTGALDDPNVFWRDKSWVGLASKQYGEVKLGRLHGPGYGLGTAGRYEAFFGDSLANNGSREGLQCNRCDDSIYYTSPTFNGANAGVIVQDGLATRKRGTGGHVAYAGGPMSVTFTFFNLQDPSVTTTANGVKTWTLGGWYDIGTTRVVGTYAKGTGLNVADTGEQVVYTFGARVPAGPGEVRASYRKIDEDQRKATNDRSSDADSTRLTTGYYYPLSKRTSLNASYVARENQVRRNPNGSVKTDRTSTGYELSLRHLF